jgi:hypothetical protein
VGKFSYYLIEQLQNNPKFPDSRSRLSGIICTFVRKRILKSGPTDNGGSLGGCGGSLAVAQQLVREGNTSVII